MGKALNKPRILACISIGKDGAVLDPFSVKQALSRSGFVAVVLEEEDPGQASGRYCNIVCADGETAAAIRTGFGGAVDLLASLGVNTLYGERPILQCGTSLEQIKPWLEKTGAVELL